ncbi:LysR family transcriptional regulator [Burkholderia sp. MSMB1459WGS]|uniref:LysR family transcriptional regulator n=1 Tax=Burkholderia sp. MSMB1459WGS TaxID=1637970 RepID=UPI0007600DFE|nr:LysR family transcriptional regulator [Burkholderia sp. MSMB1459WGS]KWO35523.1 LysR family transcriptional regulator [Burkholderia sp. MSMB1459WGS]
MEVKWIEDFIALTQHQSFSRAAEIRNVTQSGFSRRIQALEQWVGAELVDRSTYPPTLTAAGRLFEEAADDVLSKLIDTRAIIRSEHRMPGPGLQIAAGHTISLNFLPGWFTAVGKQIGTLRARVIPGNVHDSVLTLVHGACDLMFAYDHPGLPLHLDPIKYPSLTVGRDTFMPVSRPNARLGPAHRLPGTTNRPVPLISYTNTSYFGRCLALLLSHADTQPVLRLDYESDMAEVLKKMLLAGEGVAWLPKSAIETELASGVLVPAGGPTWSLDLDLRVYRNQYTRNDLLETLWRHLSLP